jgi:hypothetical protein
MRLISIYTILGGVVVLGLLARPVAAQDAQTLIVQLTGKAIGTTRPIPVMPETGTTQGNCFDVNLVNPSDTTVIGTATRCLTDLRTVEGGMALTATTFFHLRHGTIVTRQPATVQPLTVSTVGLTHLIGAIQAPSAKTILAEAGTGQFAGVPGSVRLAGALDLSNFKDKNEIAFDELALIRLAAKTASLRPADRTTQLREVQKRLQEEGFYHGPTDGRLGPATTAALSQYQAKHGLPRTGALDDATRKALGIQ